MSNRKEIIDYKIEFDDEKVVDVPDLQAIMIIRTVLDALDIDFKQIKISPEVKYTFELEKNGVTVEFVGDEPEYWYVEADLINKIVEVGIDNYRMRIPLTTILYWFSKEEKEDMR